MAFLREPVQASKTQQMYDQRVGGWLQWEDVQKARVKCFEKLDEAQWSSPEEKRFALRDAAAISLLSLIPPDRVGCIRKATTPAQSNAPIPLHRVARRAPNARVRSCVSATRSSARRAAALRWT